MPSLTDVAASKQAARQVALNRCPVSKLRLRMDPAEVAEFDRLMALPGKDMPSDVILDALRETGHAVSFDEHAMTSHRRTMRGGQGCKCPV